MYKLDHAGDFKVYKGPDRRSGVDRRVSSDRREMIRFEPDKEDRRSGKDRRKAAAWGTIASRA